MDATGSIPSEAGGIYARISHVKDDDQTGVDRQERISQDNARRAGVRVEPRHVFVDPSRSAWQRNRKRPGWDDLLKAIRAGEIRHLFVYHPDRLMRQPKDLEELLELAEQHPLLLHGKVGKRDLTDAEDRYYLRMEIAHACKSSDDTSRRVRDQQKEAMEAGRAHGGRRCYGYTQDMQSVVKSEAKVVREVYRRFLAGEAIYTIAKRLNDRGVLTATGKTWQTQTVRQLLDGPRHAGLIMFQDKVVKNKDGSYRMGAWPAVVSVGDWEEVARLRQMRSTVSEEGKSGRRLYLLRSLVHCECGARMAGSRRAKDQPIYRCHKGGFLGGERCGKAISALRLEEFAVDAVVAKLEELTVAPDGSGALTTTAAREADIKALQTRLAELNETWRDPDMKMSTAEYRSMRKDIVARLEKANRATSVRPYTALDGLVFGPGARAAWNDPAITVARKMAVLRYFIAAVRVSASTLGPGRRFDYGRIDIEWNPLS